MRQYRTIIAVVVTVLAAQTTSRAAITEWSRWHLGEAGSIVGGLPQDSVNTDGAFNNSLAAGPNNTVQTATPAPGGSTAYLNVPGVSVWPSSGAWGTAPGQTFPTDNYGFEIWASTSATTGSFAPVMTLSDAAGGYQIALSGYSGQHWGAVRDAVAWISQSDSAPVALDTWYDLALVRSGGSTQFYVNGVAVGAPYAPNQTSDGWVSFGMQPRTGVPTFTGDLDEARIFTFAPGQFSTDDLYINQVASSPPDTYAILGTASGAIISGPTFNDLLVAGVPNGIRHGNRFPGWDGFGSDGDIWVILDSQSGDVREYPTFNDLLVNTNVTVHGNVLPGWQGIASDGDIWAVLSDGGSVISAPTFADLLVPGIPNGTHHGVVLPGWKGIASDGDIWAVLSNGGSVISAPTFADLLVAGIPNGTHHGVVLPGWQGLGFSVAPDGEIPEPATMAAMGLAVAGLGGYVRRRRKQA